MRSRSIRSNLRLALGRTTQHASTVCLVALRDASPDYWGRRVIEKRSGKVPLGEMDYLLYSPDDRAGALGFGLNREPPAPRRAFSRHHGFGTVAKFCRCNHRR